MSDSEQQPNEAYKQYHFTDEGTIKRVRHFASPCQNAEPLPRLPLHELLTRANQFVKEGALEIWINPRNESNDMGPGPLNRKIYKVLQRHTHNFILIGEVPPNNLTYWHYHGLCTIIGNDISRVQKLTRSLSRNIGRSAINNITNGPAYVEYMFKMYLTPYVMKKIQPWTPNSYITPFRNECEASRSKSQY